MHAAAGKMNAGGVMDTFLAAVNISSLELLSHEANLVHGSAPATCVLNLHVLHAFQTILQLVCYSLLSF